LRPRYPFVAGFSKQAMVGEKPRHARHHVLQSGHIFPRSPAAGANYNFGGTRLDQKLLTDAQDVINNRYGEFTVMPAIMAGMEDLILERIAFGSVKDYL
jgi:hypothetical protein